MGRIGSVMLDTNDMFPKLDLQLVSGETLKLPEGVGEGYSVVSLYRGHWWGFCSQQLADFQALIQEFESEQITVIAASVDPNEKAREIVEKLEITYPIAYGLNAEEISGITGAYYNEEKKFLQPTNFLVRPDNTIEVACYSSGPIGRFLAKNILHLVRFHKGKK